MLAPPLQEASIFVALKQQARELQQVQWTVGKKCGSMGMGPVAKLYFDGETQLLLFNSKCQYCSSPHSVCWSMYGLIFKFIQTDD